MVVTTGFFDGVHLGHRLVIRQLVSAAAARGEESMIVTFWPHPRNVLQQQARSLRLLTTLPEKVDMLKDCGVDHVEVLEFTKEFSALTTEQYLGMLKDRYSVTTVLLGYDNRVGCDSSDPDRVAEIACRMGLEVIRTDVISAGQGAAVSSTGIRSRIEDGDVASAAAMLGYTYRLKGVVVAGNRLGRTIGFPTANMQLYEPLKAVPGNGVYFVRVRTLGRELYGMCNVGCRPTVGSGNARTVETNIFSFDEDIYGLDIELEFISKIREEVRYDSLQKLGEQLSKDRELCLSMISGQC